MNYGSYARMVENHDRHSLIPEVGRAAVFDGAGSAFTSTAAAMLFNSLSRNEEPPTSMTTIFNAIQARILSKWPEGGPQSTVTAVQLSENSGNVVRVDYVQAGDSSLYALHRRTKRLQIITSQVSRFPNGNTDSSRFLGSKGFFPIIGKLSLPRHVTLALITDGVGTENLQEILVEEADSDKKARLLVESSAIHDDATAIVIDIQS